MTVINAGQGSYCTSSEETGLQVCKTGNIVKNIQRVKKFTFLQILPLYITSA